MTKKHKHKIKKEPTKKKKVKEVNPNEERLEVPGALKALCIMSFIGFIYCLLLDSSDYLAYSNYGELAASADQTAFETMENRMREFEMNDIDVSGEGMERLGLMAIYRTIFDVLAMVGTALMFFKVRKGYYIYVLFQAFYIIVPFAMFGLPALIIFGKGMFMIPVIYVGLFTTQLKHLTR